MSVEDPVSLEDIHVNDKQVTVDSVINWQLPLLAILFVSVIFIAIKTVVNRHESRTAYVKLQKLEKERDKLAAQWSRLKLEQAVTLNQVRVEQYARWDLDMKMTKASEVKIIQETNKHNALTAVTDKSNSTKVSKSESSNAKSSRMVLGN